MNINKLKTFLKKYLLAPPKCIFCDSENCTADFPLCPSCFPKYTALMTEGCADCGARPIDCSCFEVKNCAQIYRLFNYDDRVVRRFILCLKSKPYRMGLKFLATRLVDMIDEKTKGTVAFDCVCFVPRNRKGYLRYGFDQAESLAKEVSKLMGIPCVKLLINTGVAGEQKRLGRAFRGQAAKARFAINPKAVANSRLAYKNAILVDDVVTTGASMGECARIIKEHGVKRVFGVFLAHTPIRGRTVF